MSKTIDPRGALIGGRYRLIELAGRGTMAEVWRADLLGAEGFHRTVALKRMSPHLANATEFRRLFVREARLNSLLDHPNVVQVLDFGVDDVGLYMVSEWVEGLTMKDIQTLCVTFGVRTSPVLVAAIGIEVLRALEAAHSNVERLDDGTRRPLPIIHRDLSPSNVLLSVRGVVKLADFGMARALDDASLTPSAALLSKIRYMAPEVAAGQSPDARSDLYSCGAMLWEAMTGVDLWAGHTTAQIAMALGRGTRPPPLREVRADVPAGLAAVIDRSLAPRYAEGYRVAATFARDLSDVLRMIPERTDTTRLANEVENALGLRRQIKAQQRHSLEGPRAVQSLNPARASVAPPPEPSADETMDVSAYFPDDRTEISTPAQRAQYERRETPVQRPAARSVNVSRPQMSTKLGVGPSAPQSSRPIEVRPRSADPLGDVPSAIHDSDRPERGEDVTDLLPASRAKLRVAPDPPRRHETPELAKFPSLLSEASVRSKEPPRRESLRDAGPELDLEEGSIEFDLASIPPEELG